MITFPAFYHLVNYLMDKNPDWRHGQAVFNAAAIISQEYLSGVPSDPFYNDDNVPAFIEMLMNKGVIV